MNVYQNREVKKLYLAVTVALVCFVLLMVGWNGYGQRRNREAENAAIARMMEVVVSTCPDADTAKLMEVLNDNKAPQVDSEIYTRFGIDKNQSYIAYATRVQNGMMAGNLLLLAVMALSLMMLLRRYLRRRQQQIGALSQYVSSVSEGDYSLDLNQNSEDELSNLKNQLYKLTLYLKEQAKMAKERKEALAESVADISHQLKTPLTCASILLDNLSDSETMPPQVRSHFLQEISNQIYVINEMVVTMLKLSRFDAGVVELQEQPYEVHEVLGQAIEQLSMIAELQNIKVEVQDKDISGEIICQGDAFWMREALQNLLKNAMEYTQVGGIVRVIIEDNQVYTALHIINYGHMITREQEKRIFERYYSASGNEGGVGIGLPLAKTIIERQRGYLSVESGENRTTFTVKLIK